MKRDKLTAEEAAEYEYRREAQKKIVAARKHIGDAARLFREVEAEFPEIETADLCAKASSLSKEAFEVEKSLDPK